MAIDTDEKRKAVAGIPFGLGVTPNASKDVEWRQQVGYSYSGIAPDTGWTLYKELKYATGGIPTANLTDFPKLFLINTDADLATELSGGGGIKFTSADGLTDLPFGLYPSTDLASGTVHARVQLSLSSTANAGDVMARLYYSASQSTTEDKAGTVDADFELFMPLEEDPSGSAPQMLDWFTETNLGTSNGSMVSGDLVDGQVGNGLDFDNGATQFIDLGTPANLEIYTNLTIRALIKVGETETDAQFVLSKDFSTGARGYGMGISNSVQGSKFYLEVGGSAVFSTTDPVLNDDAWHSIAATFNGTDWEAWIDGVSLGTASTSVPTANSSANWYISGREYSGFFNGTHGTIDEVSISSVVRSDGWMAYWHEDEFDNANTFTFGEEAVSLLMFTANKYANLQVLSGGKR